MQLVIGNKNYSSWSMRPWVLMQQLGIPFDELKLRFDFTPGSAFRQAVAKVSPAGKVPVLVDNGHSVWDTMAIIETLHESFPEAGIWPRHPQARSRARSICAEMHAGFGALRSHCPMNIEASLAQVGERIWATEPNVVGDVARIESIWAEALTSSGGPFLFGDFGAADAMFAPVCMRLRTYGLPLSDVAGDYLQRVCAADGVAAWIRDALAEDDFLDFEEPYRRIDPEPVKLA